MAIYSNEDIRKITELSHCKFPHLVQNREFKISVREIYGVYSINPGGHVSLEPVHHPRQSLSEKHPKRGWRDGIHSSLNTTPRMRTGVSLPDFLPFPRIVRGPVRGICEFDTLFFIFFCFRYPWRDTRRVEKKIPFLRVFIDADDVQAPMRHAHRGIAPRFPTLSANRPRTCTGDLWIWYPFFHIFLFSIPLARYAPGGEKDTLFTRFYWRGWCTGPNETCPPPRSIKFSSTHVKYLVCLGWRNSVQRSSCWRHCPLSSTPEARPSLRLQERATTQPPCILGSVEHVLCSENVKCIVQRWNH